MAEKQIGLFQLISGIELISEYVTDGEFYVLRAPRRIALVQVSADKVVPRLIPWSLGCPNGVFPIHTSHILSPSEDMEQGLKTAYISEITGLDLSQTTPTKLVGV